jgi:Domain of unknown function (DUF222)
MSSRDSELIDASLEHLRLGILGLQQAARLDLSADDLTDLLGPVLGHRNRFDSALTGLVGALDQRVEEERRAAGNQKDHTTSCAALLREEYLFTGSAASSLVRLARQLRELPETAATFARGHLSQQHAVAIAQTVDRVVVGGGRPEEAEPLLLVEAGHRSAYDLLLWGRHLRHQLNPNELASEEDEDRERSWIDLTRRWSGGFSVEGYLDAETGTMLKTALEGVLGPRAKDDLRSPGKRRAAGLRTLVRKVLDSGTLPVRGGARPHIILTATLETLRGDVGALAAELDWGFPVSAEFVRRIASDADLTPILLAANGDPLNVGRTRRTATRRMRKALAIRDRHCLWPGCDRPPHWCDSHHVDWWVDGGETAVRKMGSLCRRHHGMVKRGHRLLRGPDGRMSIHAPPLTA